MTDLRRMVKTAEGLTCQPKIAAAGSVTLRMTGYRRRGYATWGCGLGLERDAAGDAGELPRW